MNKLSFRVFALTAILTPTTVAQNLVDVGWSPMAQVSAVDHVVELDIVVSSNGASPQDLGALDAILVWDPAFLQLLDNDESNAGYTWFLAGFLPDPDGTNADQTDGDALFTALSQITTPATAPPAGGLVVTTIRFRALAPTTGTTIAFTRTLGMFGRTRVLDFGVPNLEITGDITSTGTVVIDGPAGNYCQLAPNSVDPVGAVISFTGSASVGANVFTLVSGPVPNSAGLFYFGAMGTEVPFGGGFRCVAGQTFRLLPSIAAGNQAHRALDFTDASSNASQIDPGETWFFQYWFRDPTTPTIFNLSDGIEVLFGV